MSLTSNGNVVAKCILLNGYFIYNYLALIEISRYISVLVELTRMEGTKHGPLVATQLLDVAIRVQAIRKYAVQQCALLLEHSYLLTGQPRATMSEVLYAAAWICGEFSRYCITNLSVYLNFSIKVVIKYVVIKYI